ncbi:MAG: hypothetical protein VB051_08810 [Candidatus Pelethousia sp.]|nr:hypothetical protein [Candidatus Pelethousia sp.]
MAKFRVEKSKGFTIMSIHHLRNKDLMPPDSAYAEPAYAGRIILRYVGIADAAYRQHGDVADGCAHGFDS